MMELFERLEFREPWLLLIAVPSRFPCTCWHGGRRGASCFPRFDYCPAAPRSWRSKLAWMPDALLALAVVALAVSLGRPADRRAVQQDPASRGSRS